MVSFQRKSVLLIVIFQLVSTSFERTLESKSLEIFRRGMELTPAEDRKFLPPFYIEPLPKYGSPFPCPKIISPFPGMGGKKCPGPSPWLERPKNLGTTSPQPPPPDTTVPLSKSTDGDNDNDDGYGYEDGYEPEDDYLTEYE